MNTIIFLNIIIIILIVFGDYLTESHIIKKKYSKLKEDVKIWKFIDIIILLISLYMIFIHKKYIYIMIIVVNLYMILLNYINKHNNKKYNKLILYNGLFIDGLIIGISLLTIVNLF